MSVLALAALSVLTFFQIRTWRDTATLFEHLKRSFHHVTVNRGPHGLPLIGRADWNDCLNLNCFSDTPGESFQTTENQPGGVAE